MCRRNFCILNPPLNLSLNLMPTLFDHEKLKVYHRTLAFVEWSEPVVRTIPRTLAVSDQLLRAASSIALNLAEASGKPTSADRCNCFDTARGSALECAACLDVAVAKRIPIDANVSVGKGILLEIVCMLVGLIRVNSPSRLHEDYAPDLADSDSVANSAVARTFDHERLEAYKLSLDFISWTVSCNISLQAPYQSLDRASTAIPLAIAEGNGKFTMPDRRRFFDEAHSSALRCASFLDLLVVRRALSAENAERGKALLHRLVGMLWGLIKRNSAARVSQNPVRYKIRKVR
jgi:four helix bundle protein